MTTVRIWWRADQPATTPAGGGPTLKFGDRDRGSATAELAVCLPALVLLVFAGVTAVAAVRIQLECVDAATQAARAAARGESGPIAGARLAPPGASVAVTLDGDVVRATVRTRVSPLGRHLPGFDVAATAVAELEPGEAPS